MRSVEFVEDPTSPVNSAGPAGRIEFSCVVDASVGVKWVLREEHSETAQKLLHGNNRLIVPNLFYIEVGNVLWRRVGSGDITEEQGKRYLNRILAIPLDVIHDEDSIVDAYLIARETGRAVYDSLYLALSIRESVQVITADKRFYNALTSHPSYGPRLRWIETL